MWHMWTIDRHDEVLQTPTGSRGHSWVPFDAPVCELITFFISLLPNIYLLLIFVCNHRSGTRGEKFLYYGRRQEAINSNGRVISLIFDGMSSFSTVVPIGGHAKEFSNPLKTHIQGCISHAGNETTFYWSLPNVMVCFLGRCLMIRYCHVLISSFLLFIACYQTGAAFQIHCVHAEIQRYIDAGKALPEKIYIQVGFLLLLTYHCFSSTSY